jgi:glycosyltransferase involved in cell wall biosynthesis
MKTVILYIGEFGMGGISRVIVRYANALDNLKNHNVEIISKEEVENDSILLHDLNKNIKVHSIKTFEMERKRDELKKKKGLFNKFIKEYTRSDERKHMKKWLKKFFFKRNDIKVLVDFDMSIWKYLGVIPVPAVGRFSFSLASKHSKKGKKMNKRMKLYDKLLIITDEMQKEMEKFYPFAAHKTVKIYNPVGIEEVEIKSNDSSELTDADKKMLEEDYMIGVSVLAKVKARDEMIRAMKLLKEKNVAEKLYLIGNGEEKEKLENLIKELNLEDQVFLLGQKKNPFIWLRNAKIFIHTSYGEGLPNVLLEAMATETPIISYDCPTGPKDILLNGECGELVEMGNVEQLADKMYKLLKDEKKQKEYKDKMKVRRQDFTIEKSIDGFVKMVESFEG